MAEETNWQKLKVVNLGPCTLVGNKKGSMWIPLHIFDDQELTYEQMRSKASAYNTGKTSYHETGIYETEGVLEGDSITSLKFGMMRLTGILQHPLKPVIAAKARTEETLKKASNLEKRLKQEAPLIAEIRCLRRVYAQLNYKEKIAFEQLILQSMRYGI